MSRDESAKGNQIKLSEALNRKLRTISASLSADIFELNKDLFEIIAKSK